MTMLKGIGASEGLAIGKVFHYKIVEPEIAQVIVTDAAEQCKRFTQAVEASKQEITEIMHKTRKNIGEEEADIFAAHLLILEDTELIDPILSLITEQKVNAEYAVHTVTTSIILMFNSMEDEYLKERALDIFDVKRRILAHLSGQPLIDLSQIDEPTILIAHDLTPSDTATLNPAFIQAIITEIGGKTSHTAIIAKSLGIPAVVGLENALHIIPNKETIIVDGRLGSCLIHPTDEVIELSKQAIRNSQLEKDVEKQFKHKATATRDGHHVELAANIASPQDTKLAHENGAEGIGLFRTEFIYMGHEQLPSEEEQYESYKKVLLAMGDKPVVVRTFDIGGDKELPYLKLPFEHNPFLGYRAIRISLDQPAIFTVQIRALLRASIHGNLQMMFPMIATVEELRAVKAIIAQEREQLLKEGIAVAENIAIGMMIEIPSTAILADILVNEVDFFSIGTNDLIQYTMAVDRMNDKISYLYQPFNPAILRLIKHVVDATKDTNVWVGVCGEMASDPLAAALLVGLGVDELSMSPSSILKIRKLLSSYSLSELQTIAAASIKLATAEETIHFLTTNLQK